MEGLWLGLGEGLQLKINPKGSDKKQSVQVMGQLWGTHRAEGAGTGQERLHTQGWVCTGECAQGYRDVLRATGTCLELQGCAQIYRNVHRAVWMCSEMNGCAQSYRHVHTGVSENTQHKQECAQEPQASSVHPG